LPSDTNEELCFVSFDVRTSFAPGITAPFGSVISPLREALLLCAETNKADPSNEMARR